MVSTIQKLEDGTLNLGIIIPLADVKKTWDEIVEEASKNADVAGFRKGMAPKEIVEEKIDKEKVREEVLKKLLPKYYVEAVKENDIKPIINPKIHVEKLEDPDKNPVDWQFHALTCEAPTVELNDYKKKIQEITAKTKIVVPGKENQPAKVEDIMNALLSSVTIKIPKILIDQETERLLAQTLDEIKSLGLSLDQYLASTNRTPQTLREEFEKKAEGDIKIEFTLQKISETENIIVEEKEVEEAIQKAKDEKEKENLEKNKYLLASIIKQQKTIDFLKNL